MRSVLGLPRLVLAAMICLAAASARAEVTLNLKDAEINTLILAVSEITGKNFIVDPKVKGKVTVISSTPMDEKAVYETFLAILQSQGFATVQAGDAIKIVPEAQAKSDPGAGYRADPRLLADDVSTQVFMLRNISAVQLASVVRPLLPQWAHLAAYPGTNSLIVSDRAGNVRRIEEIIRQLDQVGDRGVDSILLAQASAADVVRVVTSLLQQNKPAEGGPAIPAVVADERSNSVLVAGDRAERQQVVELIKKLDTEVPDDGTTQVIYLRYASAENLASVIEGYAQKLGQGKKPDGAAAASTDTGTKVVADKDTNSLVITATAKALKQIRAVVQQLDIQRAQVLVEAIIAEVSTSRQSELGLNLAAFNPEGGAVASILDASVLSALGAIGSGGGLAAGASALGQGLSAGGAVIRNEGRSGISFGVLLKALQGDSDTNVLSTPSLVSLDNEESEVSVGQEVPFLSGSFSNTGAGGSNGTVNPFQTIERKDVGLKLGVTPQINEGNTVKLKIKLESSSVAAGTAGAANLVTNKRTISNTVNVDSGQVLVLGGLIDDNLNEARSGVPFLSDVPVLGELFKSRSVNKSKRNLMVFIHPVILRNTAEADTQTRRKYEGVRQAQLKTAEKPVPLIGGQRPLLLKMDAYLEPSAATSTTP